jgi:uncharacterized protein YndB with AHSA1/START domain
MKSLLVMLGILAALLVVIVAVGAMLPKSHVVHSTARYDAKPDAVWAVIADYKAYPQWRSDVRAVEILPPKNGNPSWRERGSNGDIPYEVVAMTPPMRLVTRIADPKLPFGGTWEYDLQPAPGGGSILTITERGEVYNPVFRFVSKFVMGQHGTINRYLRSLGRKFGEMTTPREEA